MLGVLAKVAAVAASSVVILPYITALVCNLAYGWPQVGNKYRRAFSPRKVYALNYCIIQKIMVSLRYATLYMQWKAWYQNATAMEVIKDRVYGCNSQKLDLYLPRNHSVGDSTPHPLVVFAYGGAWGSGNKKMYGLLCNTLANRLNVIVCCPNHSTYPQGYADDMIQDMVDCLSWLYQNIDQYNGDKNKMMMIGHSSGAHLCAMTMLELFHDQLSQASTEELPPLSPNILHFRERHFADRQLSNLSTNSAKPANNDVMQSSTESFQIINGANGNSINDTQGGRTDGNGSSLTASQFEVLETRKSETELSEGSLLESEIQELTRSEISGIRYRGKQPGEVSDDDSGDSVITVRQGSGEVPLIAGDNPTMAELRKSLRAIVGIAGVYHIGEHFQHESSRGIEDISTMCRAMRGPDHFDRFSPTYIISKMTTSLNFPKVVLLHGTEDYVVPLSSSTRLTDELKRIEADVVLRIIPGCDHYEICLDLMNPNMTFHNTVMQIIQDTSNSVFT